MDTLNDVWKEVLSICKNRVSDVMYNMWIAPLEIAKFDIENDTVIFVINSEFKKSIVSDKFGDIIRSAFEQVMGFPVNMDIIVSTGDNKPDTVKPEQPSSTQGKADDKFSQFTFESFIVGPSNSLAYSVSVGVAENPGNLYNPLLIYGRSGLGKTHLLLAIYNKIKQKNPNSVMIYVTGENFMNELVESLSKKNTAAFHDKYRNVDALLVDDIQFIQRGVTIQEEFFHTFNALEQAGKQIVLTSDVPPREMEVLDERLRTRFEMGILADIQPPDIETRKAIILKKSRELHVNLSETVVEYIAAKIKNNVRQLEGTVKKMSAVNTAFGTPITIEQADKIIRDITTENKPTKVLVEEIIEYMAKQYGITPADLTGEKRQANINLARQITMYVIKEVSDLTLQDIGNYFNKTHATVLHSISVAKDKMEEIPSAKAIAISAIGEFQNKTN